MEEIITLDGKQFKLTTDRPLTALERAQTIDQIRRQTGCSTCHQPRALSTGGVYTLPFGNDGAGTNSAVGKGSGSTVTLSATPLGGVANYDIRFWKSIDGISLNQTDISNADHLGTTEGTPVTATYLLTDIDVAGASGNSSAGSPTVVNTGTGAITLAGSAAALAAGAVRFYTSIVDSCLGSGGRGTCAQYVDVALACIAPTCNFVVT